MALVLHIKMYIKSNFFFISSKIFSRKKVKHLLVAQRKAVVKTGFTLSLH